MGMLDIVLHIPWSTLGITCLVFLLAFLCARSYLGTRLNLPPGPVGLPLLGCVPWLSQDAPKTFLNWAHQYGDIYSLYLGNKLVVVLNTYDVIRDALVKEEKSFSYRPETFFSKYITKGHGVIWSNGASWREQRKFAIMTLRSLGAMTNQIEDKVLLELDYLKKVLEGYKQQPIAFETHLNFVIANVIGRFIFNRRFDEEDEEFQHILNLMAGWVTKYNVVNNYLNFYPWLRNVPGNLFNTKESEENVLRIFAFFQKQIDEHRLHLDDNHPTDFLAEYLYEQKKSSTFTDEQMMIVIRDLFVAAIETTAGTLMWGILYMLHHPEIQAKVQQEIDEHVPGNRDVLLKDRTLLQYTSACILEIQRMAIIDPISVPRCTSQNVKFRGYDIPEGTQVFPNFYAVNLDENNFKNARKFDPERYLDGEGKVKRLDPYVPFGQGQRVCIGEVMAKAELFLVFANLMKHYHWEKGESTIPDPLDGVFGMVFTPHPFKVITTPR